MECHEHYRREQKQKGDVMQSVIPRRLNDTMCHQEVHPLENEKPSHQSSQQREIVAEGAILGITDILRCCEQRSI